MMMRIAIGTLSLCLFIIALVSFYNYASSPTDENIFINQPSRVAIASIPNPPVLSWYPDGTKDGKKEDIVLDTLRPGDLISGLNSLADMRELRRRIPADSLVDAGVLRPAARLTARWHVRMGFADSLGLTELPIGVLVTSVAPGGASDRAGMQVGDLITRINGLSFTTAQEADRILRRAQIGRVFTYEILRGAESRTLQVTLANFGFPLAMLVFSLSGLLYLGFGSFVALKKPQLKAARLLGLSFILLGYVMAVVAIRREPDVTPFVVVRTILLIAGFFLGVALSWHASVYYPSLRRELAERPWLIRINYILAGVGLLAVAVFDVLRREQANDLPIILAALAVMALYNAIVRLAFWKKRTEEYKNQRRVIRIVSIVAWVLALALIVMLSLLGQSNQFGFVGIIALLIPLAHLYTIGRYRLLDMNLRIRRNIQYTLVSAGWATALGLVLVVVALGMLSTQVSLPNVSVHGASIEVSDASPTAVHGGSATERFVLMGLAVVVWYGIWKVRRTGQALIDKRYFRTQYDYRRALNQMSETLGMKLSMTDLGRGAVEMLVKLMHLKRAAVFFFKEESVCCCREAYGVDQGVWAQFCLKEENDLVLAMREFTGVFSVDYLPDTLKEMFRQQEFRYVVPIRSKEKLIGAFVVGEKLSESAFSQEDLAFLSAAAMQASVSIENTFLYEELAEQERMKHELEIARRIQLASLPQKVPYVGGLDIAGRSIPALEVGGDFFDYLSGTDGSLMVVIGDVSGKGTSAALYMSKVQGILRSLRGFMRSPAELLARTNELLCDDLEKSSFVTALAAAFDTKKRQCIVARAGHLPLYRYDAATKSVGRVAARGIGLGLHQGTLFAAELQEKMLDYSPGDVMVFVTDGLTEARNERGEEFGEERVAALVTRHAASGAEDIRDMLLSEVKSFANGVSQHDDQTVVVVKAVA